MNNKKKLILSSSLVIAMCSTMITGATFALFTDTEETNITVNSGKVDVVSEIAEWSTWSMGVEQEQGKFENGGAATLTDGDFTLENVTPGDTLKATIIITNESTVNVQYRAALLIDGALAPALTVTVNGEEYSTSTVETILSDWTLLEASQQPTVTEMALEIALPDTVGNDYQDKDATVKVRVEAVQGNATLPLWDGTVDTSWYNDTATAFTLEEPEELAGLAELVNAGNTFYKKTITLTADMNLNGKEWTPIGNSTNKFQGNFDGANHTVSNLSISGNKSDVGLFGYTTNGSVKNVKIHNASVSGDLAVGAVAGSPYTSTYDNITVTGKLEINGSSYVGGVLGRNVYANISNITVNVTEGSYVKANSVVNGLAYRTYVGGVIGFMGEGGHTVSNVTSNVDVYGSSSDVGGIAGIAHYGNSFINCSSSGDVYVTDATEEGDAEEMGGIAGVWQNGGADVTFTDCSFTGTLKANLDNVDLRDNTIVGAAYSATGTGKLVINNTNN